MATVIDRHLRKFEGKQLESLQYLCDTLRNLLPGAEECISYGIPTFKVDGKAVAGFEGYKNHCSYFPFSGNVVDKVEPLPVWCDSARGTLRFPIGRRLPVALVKRLVKARLAEIAETRDKATRKRR